MDPLRHGGDQIDYCSIKSQAQFEDFFERWKSNSSSETLQVQQSLINQNLSKIKFFARPLSLSLSHEINFSWGQNVWSNFKQRSQWCLLRGRLARSIRYEVLFALMKYDSLLGKTDHPEPIDLLTLLLARKGLGSNKQKL